VHLSASSQGKELVSKLTNRLIPPAGTKNKPAQRNEDRQNSYAMVKRRRCNCTFALKNIQQNQGAKSQQKNHKIDDPMT
jgi:hypothetical protein